MDTSTIRGVVTDKSGAVIPGVTVTITDVKTNRTFATTTNSDGEYSAPSLGVSIYRVKLTKAGFKTNTIDGIVLHANETLAENSVLQVGGGDQVVTVRANVIQVDSETSALGTTITAEQVAKLPLNGRDFTALLALVPGAVQNTGDINRDSIAGFESGQIGANVLVDGTDATRVDGNVTFTTFGRGNARITRASVDNIQEVKVDSGIYSAEYGRAIADIVNVITKSGSNQLHGEAFEFFRNDALDAKNYFFNKQAPTPLRLNQFGGNLGGAIIKDKLFFFANYEGVRQHVTTPSTGLTLVLNSAMRATAVPAMQPIIDKIPVGNAGRAPIQNGIDYGYWFDVLDGSTYNDIRENTAALKLDYVLSSKNNFSVRYNYNASDTYGKYGLAIGQEASAPELAQLGKFTWNYTGSTTFLNEAGFAINSPHSHQNAGEDGFPLMNCFFCNVGYGLAPTPQLFYSKEPAISYQLIDTATKIVGKNLLRFGADIRWNNVGRELTYQDTLTWAGGPTVNAASVIPCNGQPDGTNGCHDASGGPEGFLADNGIGWQRLGYPMTHMKNTNLAFFVNDEWRIRPNFGLNLGLRWDHNTVLHDEEGTARNFDIATMTLLPPNTQLYDPIWTDFAPRIGFNWDPFGKGTTTVKGGFGLFFLPIAAGSPLNIASNTQENFSINLLQIAFQGYTCNPPLNSIQFPLPSTHPNCSPQSPLSVTAFDPHQRDSYSEQWSFSVDQQVAKNTVVTAAYRGNRGLHLTSGTDMNTYEPGDPSSYDPNAPKHRYLSDNYASINLAGQFASSNYNAFNISVRTNTHGLSLQGNYNYAREYDDFMGLFEAYQNPRDIAADWSRGDSDVRHAFAVGGVYDVPRIPKVPAKLGSGWQGTLILQGRTGAPINIGYNLTANYPVSPSLRPDCTGVSWRASNYSLPNSQINDKAFSAPAGPFGNCPRNYAQGPGYIQPDLGIVKNTKLTEHVNWEFRGELFNFVNHPNFANPGTTVNGYAFGASYSTIGNLIGQGTSRQIQLSTKITF